MLVNSNTRKMILKRDNYMCRGCGSPYNLEVHHIIRELIYERDEIDNIITLCRDCHKGVHHSLKSDKYSSIYYRILDKCIDSMTDDDREFLGIYHAKREREIIESRVKEVYRLSFLPDNTRRMCDMMKREGYSNSYIIGIIIEPRIIALRGYKNINVSEIVQKLEGLKKDYGGSHED